MKLNFFIIFFSIFLINFSYSEDLKRNTKELKTRGSGGKIVNTDIKKNIEIFKFNSNRKSLIKKYSKSIKASMASPKKLKLRGAGNIYSKFANTVVYIGNPESKTVGSGFLIDTPGIILTNWHVVDKAIDLAVWTLPKDGAPSERVLFEELNPLRGFVLATNKREDLAIVKIGNFPNIIKPVTLGSINEVNIGDKVYAIGHPKGNTWSFTDGMISQIRKKHDWKYPDSEYKHSATLIQIQTPISPGNSGGPLFSKSGNLIGINTLKGKGENINFAVAVDHAINFLKKNPKIKMMNPGELTLKAKYPDATIQDYNNNGTIDTWYLDVNKNGNLDLALVDDNEDGIIEAILYDENENGVWEMQIMDDDLDGIPDRALLDSNEDKKIDLILYDRDKDGEWDK